MRTCFLDFSCSLEFCIGIFAFESSILLKSLLTVFWGEIFCIVLFMSGIFPDLCGYIHILHTSYGRVLKVLGLPWFLKLTSFFSRRWHYSSSSLVSHLPPDPCPFCELPCCLPEFALTAVLASTHKELTAELG